jgi:formate dehydrogenase alpha subunit
MTTAPQKTLALTINDTPVRVEPGATVLEAARQNGIDIPTLCHHPQLRPEGTCRLCLVEVEGARGLSPACTLPAAEGMVVRTDTPELRALRREILSLTLSEHPYSCLVCDRHAGCGEWQTTIRKAGVTTGCENCPKNGQCELQELVEKIGLSAMPYPIAYRGLPVEREDPFFDRDYNLCILCGRCVRVCQEVRLTNTLGFLQRSSQTRVGAAPGSTHRELDCEFCGACVDVCPTGALFDKRTKWEGAPDSTGKTVCPYCAVGCELDLRVRGGKVIGVHPNPDGQANRGQACVRGRFGLMELIYAENRPATPLLRRDGALVEAGWEAALSRAAERLAPYRGDAFALLGSPHLSTESAHVLGRFAREVMHSRSVDCAVGLPRHAQAGGLREALLSSPRAPIQSIRDAGCILVAGSNPRQSHPVVAMYIRQALGRGARLIVIDPRGTELARRADVWLRPDPGGDGKLLADLAGRRKAKSGPMKEALRLLEACSPAVILYGSGIIGYPQAAESIHAIEQLAASLRPSAGILPLLGASNLLGVLQTGLVAGGGDRNYDDIAAGISAGAIRALYVAGEVPPLPSLSKLELLIVQDHVLPAHLENRADIVLPAATFAETAGTMTNLEGREQAYPAVISPFRQARPDWRITAELAQTMGAKGFVYREIGEIRQEISVLPKRKVQTGRQQAAAKTAPVRRRTAGTHSLLLERNAFSYRGFSLTRGVQGMADIKRDEHSLSIHPEDAAALGIGEDDPVRIESPHGTDLRAARLDGSIAPGTVFASVNPLDGSPVFPGWLPAEKCIRVKLAKADAPAEPKEGTA